jgi:hypothetical protein
MNQVEMWNVRFSDESGEEFEVSLALGCNPSELEVARALRKRVLPNHTVIGGRGAADAELLKRHGFKIISVINP